MIKNLIEIMQNTISNNLIQSIHFATATLNLYNARDFFLGNKPWPLKCMTIKNLGKTVLYQCPITWQNQTKRMINVINSLNLISRMKLPTFIKWTSPFSSSGLLGVVFRSYSNFNRTSCKQRLESLIRHCSLYCLILVCTICLCPTKRTLG